MKHRILLMAALSGMLAVATSCNDDDFKPGNPVVDVVAQNADAFYGDSLPFTIKATDVEVPLSTLKAQLYYGEEKVSETVIRTKESGKDYTGKIYVPFLKGTPDGKATLKYVLQNTSLTITEMEKTLTLARPDYPYLTLVADDKEYRMERTALHTYTATEAFPAKVSAYIVAPKYGDNGNELSFGWNGSEVELGAAQVIPFSSTTIGRYDITFNTLTFEASPFTKILFNGKEMSTTETADIYTLDTTLNTGDIIGVEGISNIAEWWIDPDYFERQSDGTLKFLPMSGKYRVTANGELNYFIVEVLADDGNLASMQADGSGALWVIGENVGKPSLGNAVGWTTEKALCMAPIAPRKYSLTVTAGRTIDAGTINFKFFGEAKGWGNELTSAKLTTTSDIVFVGDGSNGRDNGNLGLVDGKSLQLGGVYRFIVDASAGSSNCVLTVEYVGEEEIPSADVTINGVKLEQIDADNYQATLSLKQGSALEVTGISDIVKWYIDPDYVELGASGAKFLPVDGDYRIKVNTGIKAVSFTRMNGSEESTLSGDGHGALWLMGWGVGSPSLDGQFGWTEGAAYCMAEIQPKIYQFTGAAGPEHGSSYGQRFRFDYLSFKFFHQDGWGGEYGSDALTIIEGADLLKGTGNYELADGVQLEEGATYRITVDLTAGNDKGTISFKKL